MFVRIRACVVQACALVYHHLRLQVAEGWELKRSRPRRRRGDPDGPGSVKAWTEIGEVEEAELKAAATAVVAAAAAAAAPQNAADGVEQLVPGRAMRPGAATMIVAAAAPVADEIDECLREVNARLHDYGPVPVGAPPPEPMRAFLLAPAAPAIPGASRRVTRIMLERPSGGLPKLPQPPPPPPPPPQPTSAAAASGLEGAGYAPFGGPRPRVPATITARNAALDGTGAARKSPLDAGWGIATGSSAIGTVAAAAATSPPPRLLDRALAAARAEDDRRRRREAAAAAAAATATTAAASSSAAGQSPAALRRPVDGVLPTPYSQDTPPSLESPLRSKALDERAAALRQQLGLHTPAALPLPAPTEEAATARSLEDSEAAKEDVLPSPVRPYAASPGTNILFQRPAMATVIAGSRDGGDNEGVSRGMPRALATTFSRQPKPKQHIAAAAADRDSGGELHGQGAQRQDAGGGTSWQGSQEG